MFVFQMPSRRETNQEMTGPRLLTCKQFFRNLPHQDTLCRLLEKMDVDQIEIAYIDMLRLSKKNTKDTITNISFLITGMQ
jgi:hypothetical protein